MPSNSRHVAAAASTQELTADSAVTVAAGGQGKWGPNRRARPRFGTLGLTAAVLGSVLFVSSAGAVDVNHDDYIAAPVGTNLFVFYSQYAARNEYTSNAGVTISNNTSLDSYIDTLRYVRYIDIFGLTGTAQLLVPIGTLYNAELGGAKLGDAAGVADPILANSLWLLNDPAAGRYFAFTSYIFVPIGKYSADDALNLGENRWKFDLQAGYHQKLGYNFSFQLTGDVMWYGVNDGAGGGGQRLTQDNTYQFQAWLSYQLPDAWSAAVGYSKYWGGAEYLNGIQTGNATDKDQVRFEVSKSFTPTLNVLAQVGTDLNASGGFKEDFRGLLRVVQVF